MINIKQLQSYEFEIFLQACKDEGWDNNLSHLKCLYRCYGDDFFVSVKNEKIVGYIIALKESENYGVISNLLVLKKYRNNGYAKELLMYGLKYLKDRQVSLDSIDIDNKLYESIGFKTYYKSYLFYLQIGAFAFDKIDIEVDSVNLDSILKYNKKNKILRNEGYSSCLFNANDTTYRAIYKDNELLSYGFTLVYKDGYKIVLICDAIDEALALFSDLCKNLKISTHIYFEVSQIEAISMNISKKLSMKKLSSTTTMYNKILN